MDMKEVVMAYYFKVLSHNSKPSSSAVFRFLENFNLLCIYFESPSVCDTVL
jgi:hypothetical protein